jgi:predicted secreted protein
MKTLNIALVAATLLVGAVPAIAADAPSYKDQMTNLWIATGDANYARAAGLNDRQIDAVQHQAREGVSLESATSNAN